jgi:hypothetical protein
MNRFLPVLASALVGGGALLATFSRADEESKKEPYMQGLGEFMLLAQLHHEKLWFAGSAGNWDLAAYESDELKEALTTGVKYYPDLDGVPVAANFKANTEAPFDQIDKAIDGKDKAAFATAFNVLTNACTNCHAASKHGFIRIQKPTSPELTNQLYAPK